MQSNEASTWYHVIYQVSRTGMLTSIKMYIAPRIFMNCVTKYQPILKILLCAHLECLFGNEIAN